MKDFTSQDFLDGARCCVAVVDSPSDHCLAGDRREVALSVASKLGVCTRVFGAQRQRWASASLP